MAKKPTVAVQKLSHEQFTCQAIRNLRRQGFKGIHTVFSGFNDAFRAYYDGADPVEATKKLAEDGKIEVRLARGGATLYLPKEAPKEKSPSGEVALKAILGM